MMRRTPFQMSVNSFFIVVLGVYPKVIIGVFHTLGSETLSKIEFSTPDFLTILSA